MDLTNKYGILLSNHPTLPSLALGIYKTKYYEESYDIKNLGGICKSFIKEGYYGGVVDVYKPHGKNLYCYDINSLYPYSMLKPMPIGQPTYINGNIDLNNFFGFLRVNVTAPDINIPFLPYKHNNFLICPTGSWTGIYFSEEIKYAKNLGYKFEIIEGFKFNQGYPFNKFVNDFYDIKKNSTGVEKLYAKLILNSLYGRMGMNDKYYKAMILKDKTLID
jgi:hypothetical protein